MAFPFRPLKVKLFAGDLRTAQSFSGYQGMRSAGIYGMEA